MPRDLGHVVTDHERCNEARTLARYERDRRKRAEERLRELRGQLEQFRLELVEELELGGCEIAAVSDEPPTVCLTVARGMLQARREKRAAAEAELARVGSVIERAESGVERNGRDMHDWLAQVLQVLVLERDNARLDSERAERWEIGFRNIVTELLGPRTEFEIPDVVEQVQTIIERDRSGVRPGRVWCRFAGPGRGDCLHAVGVPAVLDSTTCDEYGIPGGWCEYCWLSYKHEQLQHSVSAAERRAAAAEAEAKRAWASRDMWRTGAKKVAAKWRAAKAELEAAKDPKQCACGGTGRIVGGSSTFGCPFCAGMSDSPAVPDWASRRGMMARNERLYQERMREAEGRG